ncbi:MAG: septum formation initiator family protein [Pseudohongiellaceae bacterium]
MKLLTGVLISLLIILQVQYWFGGSSVRNLTLLQDQLAEQRAANEALRASNEMLEIEVLDLKNGLEAVEERARTELGMIGQGETFYLIVD